MVDKGVECRNPRKITIVQSGNWRTRWWHSQCEFCRLQLSVRSRCRIKNDPNLIQYWRFKCIQSEPDSRANLSESSKFEKRVSSKSTKNVTHQQVNRNFLRFVSVKNGRYFHSQWSQKFLKNVTRGYHARATIFNYFFILSEQYQTCAEFIFHRCLLLICVCFPIKSRNPRGFVNFSRNDRSVKL